MLGSRASDLPAEGVVAFARAIGAQIVHSLALIRAFEQRKAAEDAVRRVNEELEQRVRERTSELERMARLHRDMLAFVSHDLRNPLSTICLGAEQVGLSLHGVDQVIARERMVDRIKRAAKQMQNLIDGLLDMASIEDGSFSVERHAIPVSGLIKDVIELHQPIAATKSITIEVIEQADCWVLCDGLRIMQVFSNLIGNAIKFSNAGSRIGLHVRKVGNTCEFSVSDSGCGIQHDHLKHVFDRYWHATGSGRRGTGLGLAISKGIVEAHGGCIYVDSTLGHGSRFSFSLSETSEDVPRVAHTGVASRDMTSLRVLVVDDDPFLRLSIAELLRSEGFVVLEASDGAAALQILVDQRADLIVLDQDMPIMTGDEFLRARSERDVSIPVVMLSATCSTQLRGVAALVRKPFTTVGLLSAIRTHCSTLAAS